MNEFGLQLKSVLMDDLADMQVHARAAASLLKALANENRLVILCTLIGKEMSVGELNTQVSLSQSALSQHLASLREAGLVATRKESQTVFYRLSGTEASCVIGALKSIYCAKNTVAQHFYALESCPQMNSQV